MLTQIEINSGIMKFDQKTLTVKPDNRKGKLTFTINTEFEKILTWKEFGQNQEEINLILVENDAVFKKCQQVIGRVYILSFSSFSDKYFFWLQEQDQTKDNQFTVELNRLINLSNEQIEDEFLNKKNKKEQIPKEQKMIDPTQYNQLNFFQQLQQQFGQKIFKEEGPQLNKILTKQFMTNDLTNQEKTQLLDKLPESQQRLEFFDVNVTSVQFQQALDELDEVLNSENCQSILQSFEIYDEEIFKKSVSPVDAFIKMMIKKFGKKE